LEVLLVDVGESSQRVRRLVKRYSLPFKLAIDGDAKVAFDYEILGVPTYILIDKKGRIVAERHQFPEDYRDLISERQTK
jgi:peroxiredoxin